MAEATTPVENKKKEIPPPPEYPPISVTRNEVTLPFPLHRIVRGPLENKYYPAPNFLDQNISFEQKIKWLGSGVVENLLQAFGKKIAQDSFFDESVVNEETGEVNFEAFIKAAETDFSMVSIKMAEIDAKIDEITAQQLALLSKFDADAEGKVDQTVLSNIKDLGTSLSYYRDLKDKRSKSKKNETEASPAIVS